MRHTILLLLLLAAHAALHAQTDSLATREHGRLLATQTLGRSGNPALMATHFATSYSEIAADFSYSSANRPLLLQTGDGERFGHVEASSYQRLSERTAVWGEASYRTGSRRNVKWCSTADFLLIYPHVMGDTLGGNLSSERYTFAGGWASRLGRLTLGAQVDFRAEHEYRTVDPRPRSIVTDLSIDLGATLALPCRYAVGATVGASFYKQTNTVKFFREDGVIPEYQMVGLGMDYKRFSGSNASAYYKATGWSAGLGLQRADHTGAFLSARFAYKPYRRILPNYNALPMTTLYVESLAAELGWRFSLGQSLLSVYAAADWEHRAGDEHLAGNASSSEYRVVADLTTYHAHTTQLYAGASLSLPTRRGELSARLEGGLVDYAADYLAPHRELSLAKAFGRADVQYITSAGPLLLTATLHAAYTANTSRSLTLPYASMDEANAALMDYTYDRLTASYLNAGADVRADLPLSVRGLKTVFLRAGGAYTTASDYNCTALSIAAGLSF